MRRMLALLAIGAVTVAVLVASAGAAPPSVQVFIQHKVKGCHVWSINDYAYNALQRTTVQPGTTFRFTNNDLMPHLLVQVSGPKVTLHTPNMNKAGAHASLQLFAKGTYVFKTKAGEDWVKGVRTIGEDNVLKLVVTVK